MRIFYNQLTIATKSVFRNFQKNWQYGSLNILGLAIAFATLILIVAYLYQETSYETFHKNAEKIFRPTYHFNNQNGYNVQFARIPNEYINELTKDIPEIEKLIRFQNKEQKYVRIGDQRFKPKHAYTTDAAIFEVFLPLISGNAATALKMPNSVVLSESLAKKYFSSTAIIGKELIITGDYSAEEKIFKVTGVMQDLSVNTHLPIEMLFSFTNEAERTGWAYVYTLLSKEANIETVIAKMPDFVAKYDNSTLTSYQFQAIKDIHLTSNLAREIKPNGQMLYIKIFFWVGLFVWLIALVNFANLSAALAMGRGKEIGVRKVLGASKTNLVFVSFSETIVYSLIALFLGTLMAIALFPFFSNLTGVAAFPPTIFFLLPFFVGLSILSGIIAGILPALVATSIKILQIIKQGNSWSMKRNSSSINVKRGMITLQFCATIILMGSALVAHQQFNFIQNKNLGLQSEQIITIANVPSKITDNYLPFKNQLKEIAGVQTITACMQMPSSEIRDVGPVRIQGLTEESEQLPMMDIQIVDPDTFFGKNQFPRTGYSPVFI